MTITLTLSWWMLPTLVTVAGLIWALFIYDDGAKSYGAGIGNLVMLIPVMAVSLVVWIIAAIVK